MKIYVRVGHVYSYWSSTATPVQRETSSTADEDKRGLYTLNRA